MATGDGAATVLDQAPPFPDSAGRWLARLCLLEGLPFEHLVPDARMLPAESMRFFFVDQNWLDALVDGALSIGATADQEATTVSATAAHVRDLARRHAAVERTRRRAARATTSARSAARTGSPLTTPLAVPTIAEPPADLLAPVWSGFVLRSTVVTDWPGLRVTASDAAKAGLDLLRLDRPSPGVMVAIFDGIAAEVDLATPAQTLHFGAIDDAGQLVIRLRYLGGDPGFEAGRPVMVKSDPVSVRLPTRADAGRQVADVRALVSALTAAVGTAYAGHAAPPVDPGAVGVELVAASEKQAFVPSALAPVVPPPRRGPESSPPPPAPRTVQALIEGMARDR
jgi:hypothetical protein